MHFVKNINLNYLNAILTKKQIRESVVLFVLMFFSMILEIIVLRYLLSILNYFSGQEKDISIYIKYISNFFPKYSAETFFLLFFVFVFFIKTFVAIFVNKRENKFLTNLRASLSFDFYKNYLDMPLIYKLRKNSSDIIKNITNEIDFLTATVFSISVLIMEILIIMAIFFVLAFHNFLLSVISISMLLSLGFLFNFLNKKKILHLGRDRSAHLHGRYKNIIETFSGFKEIELSGKLNEAKLDFNFHNNQISKINYTANFRSSLSRPVFEIFLVIILIFMAFFLNITKNNASNFIPTIGIFLIGSYRLIPSFGKIFSALQRIQLNSQSIPILYQEKVVFNENKIKRPSTKNFQFLKNIEFKNVKFTYFPSPNSKSDYLFYDLNLKIQKGTSVGIYGESGSGKSTLLDLFMGFLHASDGKILIDNIEIDDCKTSWQQKIAAVPQDVFIKNDTIKNNITFTKEAENIEDEKIYEILQIVNLKNLVIETDKKLDTIIGDGNLKLSGGQKQRLSIARALYLNPEILIFDESTNSLDSFNENKILNEILKYKKNKTIIWVSHNKNIFSKFDFIYELNKGKLMKGKI
jgi:ABC-type multidrug transport system fused ATPase/permease subunit